jgi:hypothetical protein
MGGPGAVQESPFRGSASTRPHGQPLLNVHQRQRIDVRLQHCGVGLSTQGHPDGLKVSRISCFFLRCWLRRAFDILAPEQE